MRKFIFAILILSFLSSSHGVLAIEVAPRISDREIVERLSRLEEGQKRVESRIDDLRSEIIVRFEAVDKQFESMDKRFDSMDKRFESMDKRFDSMDKRFDSMDKRFDSMDKRFDSMDKRFDLFTWVFELFIAIALVMLGFLIRMQWQVQKRQTQMETSLETQKDEMTFLKTLIEKLLPPKGAL